MTTGKSYYFLLKQLKDREAVEEGPRSADQELAAAGMEKPAIEHRGET